MDNSHKWKIFQFLVFAVAIFLSSCRADKTQIVDNQATPVFQSEDPILSGIGQLIEKEPDIADNYFQRASILYDRELYDAAIKDLDKAISIDSTNAEFYHLLSDSYLDYYKSGEALDIMEKVVEKFPERIPSLLKLAELQLILKQDDASFFTIQKILNLDKQNADAFFLMGMVYRAQGDDERAINSFQTSVELDPEIVDAWIILGDLFANKDFSIAARYYDTAIRLAPENLQAYHAKAFYLQNNGKTQEAIQLYKKINERDPQYTDAYLNTGILYLEMDSIELAFEHFDILVKIEPQNHLGYYYRGITRLFGGDGDAAKSDLEQALRFNPAFEKAQIALDQLDTLK